jgi:hypothetical protein
MQKSLKIRPLVASSKTRLPKVFTALISVRHSTLARALALCVAMK